MSEYRILALDGGGTWALIQVMALIDLYSPKRDGTDITGHQVLKKFDLITANSGGTLTLGGLIMDWSLDRLKGMFLSQDMRNEIFAPASFFEDPIAHLTQLADFGPKYSTKDKYAGLRNIMGPPGDAFVTSVPNTVGAGYGGRNPDVVFCGFNYDTNRETFFRSDTASLAASFAPPLPVTIAQAIHASANPPVNYFDAPAELPNYTRFWDGAVGGYNNPVLAGVIEAIANAKRHNTDQASIKALSIGTGNVALPPATGHPGEDPDLVSPRQNSTIMNDLKKMASCILDDPPDAATFHAHIMLGGPLPVPGGGVANGQLVRLNPLVQPDTGSDEVPWKLPGNMSLSDFKAIRDMPMDATTNDQLTDIQNFASAWLTDNVRNQPIRANSLTLAPEIGFLRYSQARAAALGMFS